MRDVLVTFIAYSAAIDGALLGLWLAEKWPAPNWKQFSAAALFVGMNIAMQLLLS